MITITIEVLLTPAELEELLNLIEDSDYIQAKSDDPKKTELQNKLHEKLQFAFSGIGPN